jgi:hypothetical protein
MEKTYAIFWMAPDSQRSGMGKAQFTREEAESLAADLNDEHPSFIHTAIDTAAANVNQEIARAQLAGQTPPRNNIIRFPDLAAADAASREAVGL